MLILFGQWCSFKLKKGFLIPNIVILGGIILAGAFVYYWRYKRNGKQKAERIWKYDLIVRISLIILFVVQIFIAYNIVFELAGMQEEFITVQNICKRKSGGYRYKISIFYVSK